MDYAFKRWHGPNEAGKPTGDSILDSLIEESIDEETPPKGIMAAMDMFTKTRIQAKSGSSTIEQQIERGNYFDV